MRRTGNNKKDCVLYYGVAITDKVQRLRRLATINVPGTNRMYRLAEALRRDDRKCIVVSPGIFPRIKNQWKVIPSVIERRGKVIVLTLAQVGVCWLGFILAPISAVMGAIRIAKEYNIKQIVHYNFTPDGILVALWCRLFYHSKSVVDLEDINIPRLSDWTNRQKTKPIHQLAYWLAMRISVSLSRHVIVPTRRFCKMLPKNKKYVVVSGCQSVLDCSSSVSQDRDSIHMLMSGGTNPDYGARIIADALDIVEKTGTTCELELFVCGKDREDWFAKRTGYLKRVKVHHLGFLATEDFKDMYRNIDLCFALMDPNGREGDYKTPSKGYEAMCSGKALIVSNVGDFDLLPKNVCFYLPEYTAESLAKLLSSLTKADVVSCRRAGFEYAKENFDIPHVRNKLFAAGL